MSAFLRRRWQQKPKQWGPFNRVQSSLFHNLESIGVDHQTCLLALPCWGPGDQFSYGYIPCVGECHGATCVSNSIYLGDYSQNYYVSFSNDKIINIPTDDFSIVCQYTALSLEPEMALFSWGGADDLIVLPNDSNFGNAGVRVFWRYLGSNIITASEYNDRSNEKSTITFASEYKKSQKVYLNNSLVGSAVKTNTPGSFSSFRIGGWSDGTKNFNGSVHTLFAFSIVNSKILEIQDNPNALWKRVAPVNYFFPVGGSGDIFDASCLDGFNLNDSISRNAIFSAVANETLSLSSSPGNIGNFLSSTLSQISMTGSTSTRMILLGNVADSIGIDSAASALSAISGLVSDSVNLSDATIVEGIFQGDASDSVSFADAVVNSLITQGIINEIVNLSDATSLGAFIDAFVSDQITLSDGSVNVASLVAAIQDDVNISDSVTAILQALASASDTINLSDLAAWGAVQQALALSGLSLTDSAAINLQLFAQSADSIIFNDASHMTAVFNVSVTDAVSFAETISKIALFQASVADSARFSATAMEVSTLPNGKVTVSFDMKIPGVGFEMKTATITFNLI